MWGAWLIILLVVFSFSSTANSYYTAALSPPIAALLGYGCALVCGRRGERAAWLVRASAVALSCAYGLWLLPASGVGRIAGLPVSEVVLGLAALAALLLVGVRRASRGALMLAAAAMLTVRALASASIVANDLRPFDTPFEPIPSYGRARALGAVAGATAPLLPRLEQVSALQPDLTHYCGPRPAL